MGLNFKKAKKRTRYKRASLFTTIPLLTFWAGGPSKARLAVADVGFDAVAVDALLGADGDAVGPVGAPVVPLAAHLGTML